MLLCKAADKANRFILKFFVQMFHNLPCDYSGKFRFTFLIGIFKVDGVFLWYLPFLVDYSIKYRVKITRT